MRAKVSPSTVRSCVCTQVLMPYQGSEEACSQRGYAAGVIATHWLLPPAKTTTKFNKNRAVVLIAGIGNSGPRGRTLGLSLPSGERRRRFTIREPAKGIA